MQPAYPTPHDLRTAAWLKHFATHLPAYAAKYHIAEAETAALQRAALTFLDGLAEQICRVTQAILHLAGSSCCWPPAAVPWRPGLRALPQQAAVLGYRILCHAAYDPADGSALGLEALLGRGPQGQRT